MAKLRDTSEDTRSARESALKGMKVSYDNLNSSMDSATMGSTGMSDTAMKNTDPMKMGRMTMPSKIAPAGKMKKGGKVEKVMREFKAGKLHSTSKKGPTVTSRKQAIAIALSEAAKSKGRKK